MEQFGRFEIENSISEIVRQGKIEIKMLRTSLTMSAGASSFRASLFSEQAHHLQAFLSHLSMVPSRLPRGRSFGHTYRGTGLGPYFGVLNQWRPIDSPAGRVMGEVELLIIHHKATKKRPRMRTYPAKGALTRVAAAPWVALQSRVGVLRLFNMPARVCRRWNHCGHHIGG